MYRILGARGQVRQKRSRPMRARLMFSCPKVSIVLESINAEPATLFEVAMQQLECSVLAGSQKSRQLQSGTGPLQIDVRPLLLG